MLLAGYLVMCTIFGTTYLAIKLGIDAGLPPLFFAALRFALAGPLALGLLLVRRLPLPKRREQYLAIALVGLFNTTFVYAALFWAEQYISSGMAAILLAASPMLVVLIQNRWRQSGRWIQWAGIASGISGVLLVISQQLGSGLDRTQLGAAALLLLCGLSLAYGSVHSKAVMATGVHPLALNALQMLSGGLGLLLCSLLLEFPVRLATIQPSGWGAVVYLSIIGSILGFGIYYALVSRVGPLFPSTWTYVAPVIATIAGALVLREPAGWQTVTGLALVLTGAAVTDPDALRALLRR